MTTATTKTRQRRAKAAGQALVPKGPCVGFDAVDSLIWRARVASMPTPGYVDLDGFDDALAAAGSAVDDALAEHQARAREYDTRERALRGQRPVRHARVAVRQSIPVAVATASGAFYRLNSRGDMVARPMSDKAEKAMAALKAAYDEEDGIPLDDPGPVSPAEDPPTRREDRAGPGSPPDDPALDKARDDQP